MKGLPKALVMVAVCELAGAVGAIFTASVIPSWYAGLAKPPLTPPGFVFGPVWTLLYALMGIAAFLVWKRGSGTKEATSALRIFSLQLILNVLWSIIFFGLQNPAWAFVEIVLLWSTILWTTVRFAHISKAAIYLMLPYLIWVSFAVYLNWGIWMMNR